MALGEPNSRQTSSKIFSVFNVDGQQILGELTLDGEKTNLHLSSRRPIPYDPDPHALYGESIDHRKLSLYECVGYAPDLEGAYPKLTFNRNIFPHYVLIGPRHYAWKDKVFCSVYFKADDLGALFSRARTFGSNFVEGSRLDEIILPMHGGIELDLGELPLVFWYANRNESDAIALEIGTFEATVNFKSSVDDILGISCPSEMVAGLTYNEFVSLDEIITDVTSILDFITAITGRTQGLKDLSVRTASTGEVGPEIPGEFCLCWSLAPQSVEEMVISKRDLPVTISRDKAEFKEVFSNWINKHAEWRGARSRILQWKRRGHHYDSNRLIAAANSFDILPDFVYPEVGKLSDIVASKRDRCKAVIMELDDGAERTQILNTLKFWGNKLADKLSCRSFIVIQAIGYRLPGLDDVLRIALKARNYYVHGTDYGHKYYEDLFEFLTDTLEFVFLASDLIECGWDASGWAGSEPSFGNPLASYLYSYESNIELFNMARENARLKT